MNNLVEIHYSLAVHNFAREQRNHVKTHDNSCPLGKNPDSDCEFMKIIVPFYK